MPGPTITFAFVVATLYGALFHVIQGGDVRRLAMFLLTGWIGFALGHVAGVLLGFGLFNVGPLRIVPASIGALVGLVFVQVVASRTQR